MERITAEEVIGVESIVSFDNSANSNNSTKLAPCGFYSTDRYRKFNLLISAKYNSSLLEHKVLAMALVNIERAEVGAEGTTIVRLYVKDIKEKLGIKGNGLYKSLDKLANNMTGRTIGVTDPVKKVFDYIAVIDHSHYEDGVFTIEFNRYLRKYIENIREGFTIFTLEEMCKFNSVSAFRLYENLQSQSFTRKGETPTNNYLHSFDLSELKLVLGVVNANNDKVKNVLKGSKNPNFDKAIEIAPEKHFNRWVDFRRYILEPAIAEINEKAYMHVDYKAKNTGSNHKVYGIDFYVELLEGNVNYVTFDKAKSDETNNEDKLDIQGKVIDLIEEKIKFKDAESICKAANYNFELIKKQYELSKSSDVKDIVGWLISAIKNNYEASTKSPKKIETPEWQRKNDIEDMYGYANMDDFFFMQEEARKKIKIVMDNIKADELKENETDENKKYIISRVRILMADTIKRTTSKNRELYGDKIASFNIEDLKDVILSISSDDFRNICQYLFVFNPKEISDNLMMETICGIKEKALKKQA